MYYVGRGVSQDYGQAYAWYHKAADKGDPLAQFTLGYMFENGMGIPQDYAQAISWYRKAAEQGNDAAENNLGTMYYKGQGVARNLPEAQRWFRKAAEHGNVQAKQTLSTLFFQQSRTATPSAEPFDSIDAAVSDCEIKEIATGRYFLYNLTTGRLDLQAGALRVISACLTQSNAWVDKCIQESGNAEGCTKGSLVIPEKLIKDAWTHRNNLKAWEKEASK